MLVLESKQPTESAAAATTVVKLVSLVVVRLFRILGTQCPWRFSTIGPVRTLHTTPALKTTADPIHAPQHTKKLSNDDRQLQIKAQIFDRGGVSGLRNLCADLQRMDRNGSGLLERADLCEGLTNFGLDADDGPGGDVDKIMGFFDRDCGGRISIQEFHRGLRVSYRSI